MVGKIRQLTLICISILTACILSAQSRDTVYDLPYITLDSFVLEEVQQGFNIQDFISFTQSDSTFYQAFQNLRKINYHGSSTVRMFSKEHLAKATYSNRTFQHYSNNCRWMDFDFEVS